MRGTESWARYLRWVDVKRGPTGKERIIYGLYSIGSSARDAIERARKSAAAGTGHSIARRRHQGSGDNP